MEERSTAAPDLKINRFIEEAIDKYCRWLSFFEDASPIIYATIYAGWRAPLTSKGGPEPERFNCKPRGRTADESGTSSDIASSVAEPRLTPARARLPACAE